ncbi:MAG: hypothetical protein J2O48_01875 [Solirubrobacterales bacterium]|nr:hypothetical protein [Solirubrobacterales bacterium]
MSQLKRVGLRYVGQTLAGIALAVAFGGCGAQSAGRRADASVVNVRGAGFTLKLPAGYKPGSTKSIQGVPAGVASASYTPGGAGGASVPSMVAVLAGNHAAASPAQIAQGLHNYYKYMHNGALTSFASKPANVPGAKAAEIVHESDLSHVSGLASKYTRYDDSWLIVETANDGLREVDAVNEPERGGQLDGDQVIRSFRLTK